MDDVDLLDAAIAAFSSGQVPTEQPESDETKEQEVEVVAEEAKEEASEAKEEGSEEEQKEEDKEEEKEPEKDEKAVLLEKRERQVQHLKKKLAVEASRARDLDAKLRDMQSKDIPRALEVAAARKEGNLQKMLELMGVDSEMIIDYYANAKFLENPDSIKEKLAQSKVEQIKKEAQAKQAEIATSEFTHQAKTLINKHAEALPILASLGQEGIDQARQMVIDKWQRNPVDHRGISFQDKMIAKAREKGLEPNFEFCAKHVLPELEQQLKKKYEPIVKVFSKFQPESVEKESPKAKEKKVEEKKPAPKVEAKQEEKAKSKPVVRGSSGTRVESIQHPMTEEERFDAAVRAFK